MVDLANFQLSPGTTVVSTAFFFKWNTLITDLLLSFEISEEATCHLLFGCDFRSLVGHFCRLFADPICWCLFNLLARKLLLSIRKCFSNSIFWCLGFSHLLQVYQVVILLLAFSFGFTFRINSDILMFSFLIFSTCIFSTCRGLI